MIGFVFCTNALAAAESVVLRWVLAQQEACRRKRLNKKASSLDSFDVLTSLCADEPAIITAARLGGIESEIRGSICRVFVVNNQVVCLPLGT